MPAAILTCVPLTRRSCPISTWQEVHVTVAADRAGSTKQAMGRLATELESSGYIRVRGDPRDARARVLQLTKTGKRLMLDSLEIMAELERRYARTVGRGHLAAVLRGLAVFVDVAEQD